MRYAVWYFRLFMIAVPLIGDERGQVSGTVLDSSGGALADASVTVTNYETGIRRSARPGLAGEYAIGLLLPGNYKVTARKAGFQTVARLDVQVNGGEAASVDFTVYVGSMREVITIRGAPPA